MRNYALNARKGAERVVLLGLTASEAWELRSSLVKDGWEAMVIS